MIFILVFSIFSIYWDFDINTNKYKYWRIIVGFVRRLAIWARRVGARWPAAMCRRPPTATDRRWATATIVFRRRRLPIRRRPDVVVRHPLTTATPIGARIATIPTIHSECSVISCPWIYCNGVFPLSLSLVSSQSSSADNWGGFDTTNKVASPPPQQRPESAEKRSSSKPLSSPDFNAIDVKSQKPKANTSTNKTKKIEDDAWDLLNN